MILTKFLLVLLQQSRKKQCIVCLWLSIIFQTWGPFKYFVVSSSSLRALWGACHRHNWGLCINSDWSYDCSIVGHKLDIRQHVVKKKQRDEDDHLYNWRKSKFHFFFLFKLISHWAKRGSFDLFCSHISRSDGSWPTAIDKSL